MGGDDHRPDDEAWAHEIAAPEPIAIVFDGSETGEPPRDDPELTPRRRRSAIISVVALIALGGAIVVVNSRNDGAARDDPVTTDDVPETTLSALPDVATTDETAVGENEADAQPEQFPDDIVIGSPAYNALPRGWSAGTVDVPPSLATIAPTTVVILTTEGVLREVDLPSGNTRDIPIGDSVGIFGPSVAVGRSSTLVTTLGEQANPAGQPFSLLRAGEPALDVVVPLQASEIRERPGTDEFVGLGVDLAASSLERVTVGDDGVVTTQPIGFGPDLSRGALRYTPTGNILVSDGGAVFERDAAGATTLVAAGELIASSSHHVLTRSCTELYVCDGVLIDGVSDERSTVQLDPAFVPSLADGSAQISPNGEWLRYRATDLDRGDRVLNLLTGEVTALRAGTSTTGNNDAWAPDSSGFFRMRNEVLEFYDVTTGEITSFVDELGRLADFGVRLDATGTPEPPDITNTAIDLRLVAIDENGSFHDLDLTTGAVTTFPMSDPRTFFGPSIVMSGGSSASAVAAGRGPSAFLDRTLGNSEELEVAYEGTVYRGPRNDTMWRPASDDPDGYVLVDFSDDAVYGNVSIPDGVTVVGGDPSGGLVGVRQSGAVSLVHPDSVELLTSTGELLGIGSTTVIVRECTNDGDCGEIRIDRASGTRSPVDLPVIAVAQTAVVNGTGSFAENTVSPDGEVLISSSSDGTSRWIVADLTSGALIDIDPVRSGSRVAWTDDSSHAVFQSGDALFVFDRAVGRVAELVDAPPIVGFAAL